MAKDHNPKRKEERLPGRNKECEAEKGLNSKPNQTTTLGSRKK
jgi:hypothetical protein